MQKSNHICYNTSKYACFKPYNTYTNSMLKYCKKVVKKACNLHQMVVFDFSLVLFDDMLYYNKIYERDVVDMIDNNTQFFRTQPEKTISVEGILEQVYLALKEKGYNPVNQIVGYIMSGDPTYITSHNNARSLIMKVERDELVEEVIKYFIEGKGL